MNIRNCPWRVIRTFTLLNFKSNDYFSERTVNIRSGDLKSRIDKCQKDCAFLKDKFYSGLHDTKNQVKDIGRALRAMKDEMLGALNCIIL